MRFLILFLSLLFFFQGSSQKVSEVINAEKAFARYAIEHNTKEAFLAFSDDSGLVFNKGKAANAKSVWTANAVPATKLFWRPSFAGLALSGELGFTTGPWEAKKSERDTALAVGEYTTIWHKNNAGEWKFLLDMGISYKGPQYNWGKVKKAKKGTRESIAEDALTIDKTFIYNYEKKGNAAFVNVLHADVWCNLQGLPPLKNRSQVLDNLETIPKDLQFVPLNGGMAESRDFAYVYGTVKNGTTEENYLRIWQYTSDGWKLLVQVLKW